MLGYNLLSFPRDHKPASPTAFLDCFSDHDWTFPEMRLFIILPQFFSFYLGRPFI